MRADRKAIISRQFSRCLLLGMPVLQNQGQVDSTLAYGYVEVGIVVRLSGVEVGYEEICNRIEAISYHQITDMVRSVSPRSANLCAIEIERDSISTCDKVSRSVDAGNVLPISIEEAGGDGISTCITHVNGSIDPQ